MKPLTHIRWLMSSRNCSMIVAVTGIALTCPVASAADSDGDGVPDDWELAHPGILSVWPPVLSQTLLPYNTAPRSFLLNNDTPSTVSYTATLSNNTVPIYGAADSITGGITYAWDEISATGTLLTTISNADDDSEPVAITGFTFPFYGTNYSQVYVSSNGLLSFDYGNNSGGNAQIPGPGSPVNTIAAFWDDLDTRTTGAVYYKQEATRLIIQFQSVGRYGGGSGNYTFQAVLHSSGKIELRYKTMTGILNAASIGLEGEDQTYGVGIVNNAAYVTNNLAVRFDTTSKFFNIPVLTGSVPGHSVGSLSGLFDSLSLPPGTYTANVSFSHTGAGPSPLALTASLTVPNQPGAISITSPTTGSTAMQGTTVLIETNATDPDGLEKVEFYDGTTKLGETPAYPGNDYYSFYWYVNENGSRSISAKAIDLFGGVTTSAPILFNAVADNDFDGMPDSWEIANYMDPNDPYDGEIDADTDGYTNLEEYLFGTDPQVAEDSDFDGMPDGWEYHNGTEIHVADSDSDTDNDGLTNIEEYWYGTNPRNFDTDGDLLPDLYEIENWLDPLVMSGEDDVDLDGLTNLEEYLNQTNPNDPDSDGDGATDGVEVGQGSDPNNPADGGNPPTDPVESLEFKVGGDYASWRMEIKSLGPNDTRKLLVVSPAPGTWETKSHKLWKNNKYEITMHHTGSRPQDDPPWYCWEGRIEGLPATASFESLPAYQIGARTGDGKYFVVKNHWIVDNFDGLLTSHLHSEGVNHVPGKKAYLLPMDLKVTTPTIDVLTNHNWEFDDGPNSIVTNCKFEIKRTSLPTWYSYQNGSSLIYNQKSKVTGLFKARAEITVDGQTYLTSEKNVEVRFPDAATILGGAGVRARMDTAWQATLSATTSTTRREEGYYITLNTSTNAYGITAHSLGNTVDNTQGAGWHTAAFPRPADIPAAPIPTDSPVYTVAWYHTHTPTFYRAVGRANGPSTPDYNWSANASINCPGFAHDYTANPVPAGHPINSAATVFTITPPSRRPTP